MATVNVPSAAPMALATAVLLTVTVARVSAVVAGDFGLRGQGGESSWTIMAGQVSPGGVAGVFDVTEFGAVGDGKHDDTAAFRAAAAAATPVGGTIRVPPVALGAGYVLSDTVVLTSGVKLVGELAGVPTVPHCFGAPGDFNTTGGSRLLARMRQPRTPLFNITSGCAVRGLFIWYDTMPFPTDAEFQDPKSPYYYATTEGALEHFVQDHVMDIGPTLYVTSGTRVEVTDVIANGWQDFLYYQGAGHGQGSVRNVQGWGYRRFIVVEIAEDVLSFENVRFIINTGPRCFGPMPDHCTQPGVERCRGNFTVISAAVALRPDNVGIWLGRADGFRVTGSFFFGINTAIRLGFATGGGNWTVLRNPVSGQVATEPGATTGTLQAGHGPWGSVSQLMVDQAQIGVHFVWPNPLTNRFADVQLHPSFWRRWNWASDPTGSIALPIAANGTGNITSVAREAAVFVESTHTVATDASLVPTTQFANLVVASFNDSANFGIAGSTLGNSNGRAFVFAGDSGNVNVNGFAMNNELNGDTHLWASGPGRSVFLRITSVVLNYKQVPDVSAPLPLPVQ